MKGSPKASIEEKIAKDYWGLKILVHVDIPLIKIISENVKNMIFGGFEKLRDMNIVSIKTLNM